MACCAGTGGRMCWIFCGGFILNCCFGFWSFPYAKDGILDLLCGFFVENVRWNVGVVTANKQVRLLRQKVSD
jgi:hypothetical protein